MAKRLRSGYTTGACAAAAAKAAVHYAVTGEPPRTVEIPFPDASRHRFGVHRAWQGAAGLCGAAVLKDAGDDPDVTNGAEIVAEVRLLPAAPAATPACVVAAVKIVLCRGEGVGLVTKAGLAVPPGEPAINPVPRRMIGEAVLEGLAGKDTWVQVTIAVPGGEAFAEKTLNRRLGIEGGLSILGTTGIVRPVSAEAWTATIKASLDVAREAGLGEVVLSTGRTSEKGVQELLNLPEEAYAMMGDYLQFSLKEAGARGFARIHLAGMWAKIVKAALAIPQTHVRHGALKTEEAVALLAELGATPAVVRSLSGVNTAREIYSRLHEQGEEDLIRKVCRRAQEYARQEAGTEVRVYLVASGGKVVTHV
jgi:cobalt-precorrin-5B (C1)-methyltransferase